MSEQRRATLTPFGKSDKKSIKSLRKSFRFSFTLSDPNEDSCPVFDYATVVKSEERTQALKKLREEKEKKPNGVVDPFNANEDEDVKRLAEKLENKYGSGKKSNWKSYAELGAGYDETDPFIDNTEANDEELQEGQETPCGGYYINSGPLELKRVEVSDHSDADEVTKRRPKRGLPLIEEDEEDVQEENEEEEMDIADTETKLVTEESPQEIKKVKISNEKEEPEENPTPYKNEVEEPLKKKKKRLLSDDVIAEGTGLKVKKAKTVKVLLEEKRVHETSVSDESKKLVASSTSISEAIESVINASNNDENSNCSKSSHSDSDDSQEARLSSQLIPSPLPENLSSELLSLVDQIRRTAAVTDNTRKTFCTDINNSLVKLEWKSREFSTTNRNLLFSHLACYLPCTKDTLMRRAKKLFIHKEESQIDTIICKLKATVDATMPSLMEEYEKECQRIAEEKGISGTPSNGTASVGEEQHHTPDSAATKLPKRKFPWTEETRGYLREIVRLKNRCYKVLKPRKSTNEEYVKTFIHTKIRSLWPSGWMKASALLRESSRSPHAGKSRHSSSRSPSKSDLSRLNVSLSYPSPNIAPSSSPYGSHSIDTSHQQAKSPTTPHAAKNGADPINLLTKIATSLTTAPKKSFSPGLHQNSKTDKPESFSVDCLLKRTSDNTMCNDYNTTLSDLMKKDSIIMNGASLPLKNVNSSQLNDSGRREKILDLSSCNSSVSVTPNVNQSVSNNDRTSMRASDSVSLSVNTSDSVMHPASTPSPCRKEVIQNTLLNRKQRLLHQNTQSNWHSHGNCDNMIIKKTDNGSKWPHSAQKSPVAEDNKPPSLMKNVERRMSDETTTATDILSQLISESLLAPSLPPSTTVYNTKVMEEGKSTTPTKGQELLYDVMQDLKELNHMSSGGSIDSKQDKKNCFTGASRLSYPKPTEPSFPKPTEPSTPYHKEFLKHLFKNRDTAPPPNPIMPYSRHSVSPYENSQYMNEISKSVYSSTTHRSAQAISSHADSHTGKVSQINQGCIMKSLPNMSSGHPHRYMTQMDYSTDDQHLLGLSSSLQYGLPGWYTGSESQSHQ